MSPHACTLQFTIWVRLTLEAVIPPDVAERTVKSWRVTSVTLSSAIPVAFFEITSCSEGPHCASGIGG